MLRVERLAESERNLRRTVADAIEILRTGAVFGRHDRAVISVGPLTLPSREAVGVVQLVFESPALARRFVVSLPSSKHFRAVRRGSAAHEQFDIFRLGGAVVDGAGTVRLSDGEAIRAVEVIPADLPDVPTELDWQIVECVISLIEAEEFCYRSLRDGIAPELREHMPEVRAIDCSKLCDLTLQDLKRPGKPLLLKSIAEALEERGSPLKVSEQKIADALRKFGIRIPKTRPRRK